MQNSDLKGVRFANMKWDEDMMKLTCCQNHILTENIWFVWSEISNSGNERRLGVAKKLNIDIFKWEAEIVVTLPSLNSKIFWFSHWRLN